MRHLMRQRCAYWPPGEWDGLAGARSYGDPVHMNCRWEFRGALYRDANGEQRVSDAVVYLPQAVERGGKLALGENPPESAGREVRWVGESPSLDASESLHKAML